MKNKDPNYVVKVEQAIAKKYGEETVQHPRANWTDDKEREYISQLKDLYKQRDQLEILQVLTIIGAVLYMWQSNFHEKIHERKHGEYDEHSTFIILR